MTSEKRLTGIMKRFLQDGIDSDELCKNLAVIPTIFTFWGMLSGLILMAVNKEAYIAKALHLSKQHYLT